jgi:hypothetical protein
VVRGKVIEKRRALKNERDPRIKIKKGHIASLQELISEREQEYHIYDSDVYCSTEVVEVVLMRLQYL